MDETMLALDGMSPMMTPLQEPPVACVPFVNVLPVQKLMKLAGSLVKMSVRLLSDCLSCHLRVGVCLLSVGVANEVASSLDVGVQQDKIAVASSIASIASVASVAGITTSVAGVSSSCSGCGRCSCASCGGGSYGRRGSSGSCCSSGGCGRATLSATLSIAIAVAIAIAIASTPSLAKLSKRSGCQTKGQCHKLSSLHCVEVVSFMSNKMIVLEWS